MQEMKRLKKSVFVWMGKKQMFYFTAVSGIWKKTIIFTVFLHTKWVHFCSP